MTHAVPKGSIHVDRHFTQSPAEIWHRLTDPAQMARWWAPGDVRAEHGHRFDLDMGPWGKQACEVTAVEPERVFQYRFAVGRLDTVVTWRIEAESGTEASAGAHVWLSHDGFDLETAGGRAAFEGMKAGWPGVLGRLGG